MLRSPLLRLGAALFVFCAPLVAVAPASAQTTAAAPASVAGVLRSLNPALTIAKAESYARSVMADAWRMHIDPKFIMSIVTVESGWNAHAVSNAGAQGLGQLMPGTAARLGVNPHNPAENLRGTSKYLKSLLQHFAGKPDALKLAIAGYNAGPKAVERYHGIPPYAETQRYVVKVLRVWKQIDARAGLAFRAAPAPAHRVATITAPPDVRNWVSPESSALPVGNAPAPAPDATSPAVTIGAPAASAAPALPAAGAAPAAAAASATQPAN